jgi:hypothetical protein
MILLAAQVLQKIEGGSFCCLLSWLGMLLLRFAVLRFAVRVCAFGCWLLNGFGRLQQYDSRFVQLAFSDGW